MTPDEMTSPTSAKDVADKTVSKTPWSWFYRKVWLRGRETWDRFQKDDGSLMAAATSFYAGLSLLPLLLILIVSFGMVLESTSYGADAREEILEAVEVEGSPLFRQQVDNMLTSISDGASLGGPLALTGLFFGALAIFAQFERAFDRIWNVELDHEIGILKSLQYILLRRFRAFIMLCGLGIMIVAIFVAGLVITALEEFASQWWPVPVALRTATELGVSLALNTLVFTLLYRWLPKVEVRWREAIWGAVLVSIGWEVGRQVLSVVLLKTNYINAYGTIGSFLAVLLWLYYVSHLLFLGAEFIQEISQSSDRKLADCDA